MQRLCVRIRGLAAQSTQTLAVSRRLLRHSSSSPIFSPISKACKSQFLTPTTIPPPCYLPFAASSVIQVRHVSSRERKKRRKPMTPVTSKLKKIKIKSYSSYKSRFRTLNDGTIRRWHEGKRHNAHLKSKKSKRRLRQPALVPAAFAKVMKKLNFCG